MTTTTVTKTKGDNKISNSNSNRIFNTKNNLPKKDKSPKEIEVTKLNHQTFLEALNLRPNYTQQFFKNKKRAKELNKKIPLSNSKNKNNHNINEIIKKDFKNNLSHSKQFDNTNTNKEKNNNNNIQKKPLEDINSNRKFSIQDIPGPVKSEGENQQKEKENDSDMLLNSKEKALFTLIQSNFIPLTQCILLSKATPMLTKIFPIKKLLYQNKYFIEKKVMMMEIKQCELKSLINDIDDIPLSKFAQLNLGFISKKEEDTLKSLKITTENNALISSYVQILILLLNESYTEFRNKYTNENEFLGFYLFIEDKYKIKSIKVLFYNIFLKVKNINVNCISDVISLYKNESLFSFDSIGKISKCLLFISYSLKEIILWMQSYINTQENINYLDIQINNMYEIIERYQKMNINNYSSEE